VNTSAPVLTAISYYLPRVMFLNSRYAPQTHWGDVADVARDFPAELVDVRSEAFWHEWQARWIAQAERYTGLSGESTTTAGRSRALRSAAACYHWAEFMDFGDRDRKLDLRSRVRDCFVRSLNGGDLEYTEGELVLDDATPCKVPYWLFLPPAHRRPPGPLPCVIMSNGLDSMTEVEVLALAETYLERGIAALLFDGPGQGIHAGQFPLRIEMETVVQALLDQLRLSPGIAHERIAFFGISFGGYLALRIAQRIGEQLACVVNISGGPRVAPFDSLPRRLKDDFQFVFACGEPVDMQARLDAIELDTAVPSGAPVLTVHGTLDDIFPMADIIALDRVWGADHQLIAYEKHRHTCPEAINLWSLQAADWVARHLLP
jgi:acetyl esterase/lipase